MKTLIYNSYPLNKAIEVLDDNTKQITKSEDLYQLAQEGKITLSFDTKNKTIVLIKKNNLQRLIDSLSSIKILLDKEKLSANIDEKNKLLSKSSELKNKLFIKEYSDKLWEVVAENTILDIWIDRPNRIQGEALIAKKDSIDYYLAHFDFYSKLEVKILNKSTAEVYLRREELNKIQKLMSSTLYSKTSKQSSPKPVIKISTQEKYIQWQEAVDKLHVKNKSLSHSAICARIARDFSAATETIRKATKLNK